MEEHAGRDMMRMIMKRRCIISFKTVAEWASKRHRFKSDAGHGQFVQPALPGCVWTTAVVHGGGVEPVRTEFDRSVGCSWRLPSD